jgi:hypothetical protein
MLEPQTDKKDETPSVLSVPNTTLPKGGGSLQKLDGLIPNVDMNGTLRLSIALPLTPARYLTPSLSLQYQSTQGNSAFGLGWDVSVATIRRRTNKGVPFYNDQDIFIGSDGEYLVPSTQHENYEKIVQGQRYYGTRFFCERETAFNRLEFWQALDKTNSYWYLTEANGTQHIFGFSEQARLYNPQHPKHIFAWLLEESWEVHGEHCLYSYKSENTVNVDLDQPNEQMRQHSAQRYLKKVSYANRQASADSYVLVEQKKQPEWFLELLFDYGEHASTTNDKYASYDEKQKWLGRADSFSDYSSGFEIRTHRLCRQVLLFHQFPELGERSTLVKSLTLDYLESATLSRLKSVQTHGYTAIKGDDVTSKTHIESLPAITFDYTSFSNKYEPSVWEKCNLLGAFHEDAYQLIDLHGEGLPGILYKEENSYFYRAAQRNVDASKNPDAIQYASAWSLIDPIPSTGLQNQPQQAALTDITGDGQLDYLITRPGFHGFFSLDEQKRFKKFIPFEAFPSEFLQSESQLTDMMGAGLADLVLIGPKSVRIYPNQRYQGFAAAIETRYTGKGKLPSFQFSEKELVAFSNLLGSSTQHLVHIQAQQISCWPHCGRGHFLDPIAWAKLPFKESEFNSKQVYLADLDGNGATDVIYVHSDHLQIFANQCGNGLAAPYDLPFPAGVNYDQLSQLGFADLYGQGTSCLVLTVTHPAIQHWVYDFSRGKKPYLLQSVNNQCGFITQLYFRSSSQEWLDEKQENPEQRSYLSFPVQVVTRMEQIDEVQLNRFIQKKQYRQAYYDKRERDFNGFGLVIQHDAESFSDHNHSLYCAPLCVKTWYHTGKAESDQTYYQGDTQAQSLASSLYVNKNDEKISKLDDMQLAKFYRSLRGNLRRQETYGLDNNEQNKHPYAVSETRYKVRVVQESQPYSVHLLSRLEQLDYTYERIPDDPQCAHVITLKQDDYGFITHQLTIHYPRRQPLAEPEIYQDEQQTYLHLLEKKSTWIHLNEDASYRLGILCEEKSWNSSFSNRELKEKSKVGKLFFSYEQFSQKNPWLNSENNLLSQWLRYFYCDSKFGAIKSLPLGQATSQALLHYTLTVELASDQLKEMAEKHNCEIQVLKEQLDKGGYRFDEAYYWIPSVSAGYHTADKFYQLRSQKNLFGGSTHFFYDADYFHLIQLNDAFENETKVQYDYRHLQIRQIIDCNDNTRAVAFDALGRVILSTFYGTQLKPAKNGEMQTENIGFAALGSFSHLPLSLVEALSDPEVALQQWAETYYYDTFSWEKSKLPTHSLRLTRDRYLSDADSQIRIQLTSFDGFGRTIAEKQRADKGLAYQRDEQGNLQIDAKKALEVESETRWLIRGMQEYNNKGEVVKMYHPYFLNGWHDILHDSRHYLAYAFRYYYDPLGRLLKRVTAQGFFQRSQYFPWYQIQEDENDTALEVLENRTNAAQQNKPQENNND